MDGYEGWYDAFWRLSTERQIGMGIGPIPASMIDRHTAGWDEDDAEAFEFCIRKMDEVYLMNQNKTDQSPPTDPTLSAHDAWRAATRSQRKG